METKYGFTKMSASAFSAWLGGLRLSRTILTIQQHHTYLPSYVHFTGDNHFERQKAMKDHHIRSNGWKDIGQHFTIFPDGSILTGRSLEIAPACIFGQNAHAICLEHFGNFDAGADQMTRQQQESIIAVTAALCRRFNLQPSTTSIVYHHWFDLGTGLRNNGTRNNKSCPGTAFFGGNKVLDCQNNFLPLLQAALQGNPIADHSSAVEGFVAVTASALRVRTAPSTQSAMATGQASVPHGAVLRVYEKRDGWLKISKSTAHWVAAPYTVPVFPAVVRVEKLRVRSGPGTDFAIVDNRYKGELVFVFGCEGNWCRIDLDGRWVSASYLEMSTY